MLYFQIFARPSPDMSLCSQTRSKRKIVMEDSDEDIFSINASKKSKYKSSPTQTSTSKSMSLSCVGSYFTFIPFRPSEKTRCFVR